MYNFTYIPEYKEQEDLDDKLINLYGSHLLDLYSALRPIYENDHTKPSLPLLLWLRNDAKKWMEADIKIIFYGRETNNWNDPSSGILYPNWNLTNSEDVRIEIDRIQGLYEGYFYPVMEHELKPTSFFKFGIMPLLDRIKKALPDKTIECIWNNVSKIGKGNNGNGNATGIPTANIHNVEMHSFNVSQEEIDILKPDITVFLTGPLGDKYINEKFPNTTFSIISQNFPELAELGIANSKYSLRLNIHPSIRPSMLPNKNDVLHKYYEEITRLIQERFS